MADIQVTHDEMEVSLGNANNKVDVSLGDDKAPMDVGLDSIKIVYKGGIKDYEQLTNHPKINSVELVGNKSFEDLGDTRLGNLELQNILDNAFE